MSNEDLEINEVEQNTFIFVFCKEEDQIRILRDRPWFVHDFSLNCIDLERSYDF